MMVTGADASASASSSSSSMLVLVLVLVMSYFSSSYYAVNCYHLTNWCIESMLLTDVYLLGCMVYIAYPTA